MPSVPDVTLARQSLPKAVGVQGLGPGEVALHAGNVQDQGACWVQRMRG